MNIVSVALTQHFCRFLMCITSRVFLAIRRQKIRLHEVLKLNATQFHLFLFRSTLIS